jgi:PilZ domain-containing protein
LMSISPWVTTKWADRPQLNGCSRLTGLKCFSGGMAALRQRSKTKLITLDRRVEPRMLCADLVDILWKNQRGRIRRGMANLEDISLSGACLQVPRPVPVGATFHIRYPNGKLTGKVRYCVFREMGYLLGIEFALDHRWSQRNFRPRHLLDPRHLVTRVINPLVQRRARY